jgi:tellurite methyltransferase
MKENDGGYERGYQSCDCFWGSEPSSLIKTLALELCDFKGLRVLDAGCGEGKNAAFLAQQGATVTAVDLSGRAISHAKRDWASLHAIEWVQADIRKFDLGVHPFDVVIAYGLYHCLESSAEIAELHSRLNRATRPGGYHAVCCFNSRNQELDAAHPGFHPCLVEHGFYCGLYDRWELLMQSDADLTETHPDNNIQHTHSMTRILARKGGTNGRD